MGLTPRAPILNNIEKKLQYWYSRASLMSMGKFCPTASISSYGSWAKNGLLRGSDLGPKIMTQIGCCGAKILLGNAIFRSLTRKRLKNF